MSDIKFRGKRLDNKEWVYGDLLHDRDYECNVISNAVWISVSNNHAYQVIPETIGQYTGLKDMNDIEIYEGDIAECKAGEHDKGVWEYQRRYVVEYGWTQEMWEMLQAIEVEVIDNIYNNPEL